MQKNSDILLVFTFFDFTFQILIHVMSMWSEAHK